MNNIFKSLSTLGVALAFVAAPAFAQNASTVSATGNDNDADVDQVFVGATGYGMNEAIIDQVGDEHEASIYQNGAGNITNIYQEGFSHKGVETMVMNGSNGNITNITQTGGDAATSSGGNSLARVELWGDDNTVDVTQHGDGQRAFVDIQQGANFRNDVDVSQNGSSNQANIDVNGDDNIVSTLQDGQGNGIGAVFGTVGVDVDGDGNEAIVQQRGDNNSTLFVQFGDGNKAVERMTNGDGNVVTIDQTGNDNRAVYEIWGDANSIDIDQTTSGNVVAINGRGTPPAGGGGVDGNMIDIDQFGGDGNMIDGYFADGSESNMVTIQQDGVGNMMNAGFDVPSGPSDLGLVVDGDFNTVDVMQTGDGNMAGVEQIGDSNMATITQN